MIRRTVLIGTGSALPKRLVTNAELAETVDTSDDWIVERSGIRQRYIAGEGETTSTLAIAAARAALEAAGVEGSSIGLIVLATATPDQTFPASATIVQDALGANGGIAFDVAAVCSGFLYALGVADSMLRTGMASRALVIGAETFSRILDWEDRTTCVLFGDGAGAVVLESREVAEDGPGPARRPCADEGARGFSPRGGQPGRRAGQCPGRGWADASRSRLGRAAPGEPANPRCDRKKARTSAREGGGHG
jgi:3-oxoacyl-[acyl-carrier-protein] synthase III